MWTELNDVESDYDAWEFTLKGALAEEKERNPVLPLPDIWPSWSEGVPTLLRTTAWTERFWKNGVRHEPRLLTETVALHWRLPRNLSELAERYSRLPTTDSREWSGVYRIYAEGQPVDRVLGKDATGTLYIGMAGDGSGRWSIMRSRIMNLATRRNHQIADLWFMNEPLERRFPWKSLMIQWAFTKRRPNFKGDEVSGARTAENFLLLSYRSSFGEFPPFNEKA